MQVKVNGVSLSHSDLCGMLIEMLFKDVVRKTSVLRHEHFRYRFRDLIHDGGILLFLISEMFNTLIDLFGCHFYFISLYIKFHLKVKKHIFQRNLRFLYLCSHFCSLFKLKSVLNIHIHSACY